MGKSNTYNSISLNNGLLRVAQLKGTEDDLKLSVVFKKDVSDVPEANLPKTVQAALRKFGPKKAVNFLILPSSMTTTKNIEVPSINEEEIKSIVNLQAGRHTPLSREEIQVDFVNVGVHKEKYSKVLLVIANKKEIKTQLDLFEKAGIKITKVLFAPEGIAGLYAQALGLKDEPTPSGVIDIGGDSTDFVITFRGIAMASRCIPIGQKQLMEEGAGAQEKLVEELAKTMESYQSEDVGDAPANYLMTSDNTHMQAIQALLTDKLKWNVEMIPYVDNINAPKGILKQLTGNFADVSFIDVISPAQLIKDMQVNLIPEEIRLQKSIEAEGHEVFKTAILGMIVFVLLIGLLSIKLYFRGAYLNKLKEDYKQKREEVIKLQDVTSRQDIIQKFLESRMMSLDTIYELYRNIPDEMYLTNIVMEEEGLINIQGVSETASLIPNLVTILKDAVLFKSVNIKSQSSKKDRGKDAHAFEITLKLQSAVDDEKEEQSVEKEGK